MGRKDTNICLFSEDGDFLRHISEEEAKAMHQRSEVEQRYVDRPNGTKKFEGVQIIAKLSDKKGDMKVRASISFSEVEINAGAYKEGTSDGRIRQVRAKIRIWPKIGDNKAVRVGPRV